ADELKLPFSFFIRRSIKMENKKNKKVILIKFVFVFKINKNSNKQKKDNIIITILKVFSPFSIEKRIKIT
ncbi:hypothetical protein, partial [Blattabacterium cuenoti]|uniref:hypothetical protein n=1 Tax=Blattabacterium cuenoti TaxID=1653831 RepID=UPI00311D5EF7